MLAAYYAIVHDAGDDGMRQDIARRIDRLEGDLVRLAPREVMGQLGAIRTLAHGHGLQAVAALAHALQDELVARGREVAVRAYLERMRDAVDVDTEAQPRFVGLALATIGAGLAFA